MAGQTRRHGSIRGSVPGLFWVVFARRIQTSSVSGRPGLRRPSGELHAVFVISARVKRRTACVRARCPVFVVFVLAWLPS